jgi:hypothetical protein
MSRPARYSTSMLWRSLSAAADGPSRARSLLICLRCTQTICSAPVSAGLRRGGSATGYHRSHRRRHGRYGQAHQPLYRGSLRYPALTRTGCCPTIVRGLKHRHFPMRPIALGSFGINSRRLSDGGEATGAIGRQSPERPTRLPRAPKRPVDQYWWCNGDRVGLI